MLKLIFFLFIYFFLTFTFTSVYDCQKSAVIQTVFEKFTQTPQLYLEFYLKLLLLLQVQKQALAR